jgi:hypothetical protein
MLTLDKKLQDELDRDNNWYNLLLSKLRAVENSGNGTIIHDVRGKLSILLSAHANANYINWDKQVECINEFSNYLDETEKWLISIAYKGD